MKLRSLKDCARAIGNVSTVINIGIIFAALMILAFIVWTVYGQLVTPTTSASVNSSLGNITAGFDSAIALIIVAVTILILAIMLSYLFVLKKGK